MRKYIIFQAGKREKTDWRNRKLQHTQALQQIATNRAIGGNIESYSQRQLYYLFLWRV